MASGGTGARLAAASSGDRRGPAIRDLAAMVTVAIGPDATAGLFADVPLMPDNGVLEYGWCVQLAPENHRLAAMLADFDAAHPVEAARWRQRHEPEQW